MSSPVKPSGELVLTTARFVNRRWLDKTDSEDGAWSKVLAHTGSYEQFAYGLDHPSSWATGAQRFKGSRPYIDGPVQICIVCSPWSGLVAADVDHMDRWGGSRTAAYLDPDRDAISSWDSGKGQRCHMLIDMRDVPHEQWPANRGTPWGDIRSCNYIPVPGSLHYSGCEYKATGQGVIIGTAEMAAAMCADAGGGTGVAKTAARTGNGAAFVAKLYGEKGKRLDEESCSAMQHARAEIAAEMEALPHGVSGDRHSCATRSVGKILGLAGQGCKGAAAGLEDIARMLEDAKPGSSDEDGEFDDILNWAAKKEAGKLGGFIPGDRCEISGRLAVAVPYTAPPVEAGNGNGEARGKELPLPAPAEKKKPSPVLPLATHFATFCDLVHDNGRAYAVPKAGIDPEKSHFTRPAGVAIGFGAGMLRLITTVAKRVPAIGVITRDTAGTVMFQLEPDAFEGPETPLALRFHHDPALGRVVLDLGRADGASVVITGEGWACGAVPPGAVFRRSHAIRELPVPQRRDGVTLGSLAGLLSLPSGEPPFALSAGWLTGLAFAAEVRPGLAFIAPPGSAKSTRLRLLVSVVEPTAADDLARSFGRKLDDDEVRALHRAVPCYDNLSSVSVASSDLLATIITGGSREGRKLYTDDELSSAPVKRPVGLTAVSVPAGLQPDALDRLIISQAAAPAELRGDSDVQAAFDALHAGLLAAWCDAVSAALAWMPKVPAPARLPRMASHARMLAALDAAAAASDPRTAGLPPDLLGAYRRNVTEVRQQAVSTDVFGSAVLALLTGQPAERVSEQVTIRRWAGTMGEFLTAARNLTSVSFEDWKAPGWPRTPRAATAAIAQMAGPLKAHGIEWTARTSAGRTRYEFMMVITDSDENGSAS